MLEQYLCCYINYHQNDGWNFLHYAKFAFNNSKHSAIGVFSFFANYKYHPKCDLLTPIQTQVPRAIQMVMDMHKLNLWISSNVVIPQDNYKQFVDNQCIKAPTFEEDDLVWLNSKNICIKRPSKKLNYRRLGLLQSQGKNQ